MKREVFEMSMSDLKNAFSHRLTTAQMELWYQYFGNIEENEWVRLVDYVIKNSERFPTVATMYRFRKAAKEIIKEDFWKSHSIYWYLKDGILRQKIVPKGQGNRRPEITTQYSEIDKTTRANNIYRANMIVKKLAESMATTK